MLNEAKQATSWRENIPPSSWGTSFLHAQHLPQQLCVFLVCTCTNPVDLCTGLIFFLPWRLGFLPVTDQASQSSPTCASAGPPTPHTCLQLHQVLLIKEGKKVINPLFLVRAALISSSSSSYNLCQPEDFTSLMFSASCVVSADAWLGDGTCLSFLSRAQQKQSELLLW